MSPHKKTIRPPPPFKNIKDGENGNPVNSFVPQCQYVWTKLIIVAGPNVRSNMYQTNGSLVISSTVEGIKMEINLYYKKN